MTLEDYQQDCQKCDHAITLESVTDMDHSGDYEDIESHSSVHTADSDASDQSTPGVSTPMPDMYHIPRQPTTVDHRNTSGINITVATLKHKIHYNLSLMYQSAKL